MVRIEVTYLVKKMPPDLSKYRKEEIVQGYLIAAPDAVRIRRKGGEYSITEKSMPIPGDTSIRKYSNINLKQAEFDQIWKIIKKSLKKTRYYYNDLSVEVRIDVFGGDLNGLVLAEVIFNDESEKRTFKPPEWFGREVTAEEWASNQYLAGMTYDKVSKSIAN